MERARWTNFPDLFRRAADYGDKSLRGAKLGNPLVEQRALGVRWRAMSKAAMASMSKSLGKRTNPRTGSERLSDIGLTMWEREKCSLS